jgi:type VI secretion system (T6SS) effector Hcp
VGIGRPWRAVLLLAVGAAGGGAAFAVASVPDGNGVIHACVLSNATTTNPNVRIIDPSAGETCAGPVGTPSGVAISWNTAGPQGLQGPTGPPGRSVTIAGGNTLTISGGQVITVGKSPGITLAQPRFSNKNVAKITFTGGVTGSSDILGFSFAQGGSAAKAKAHDVQFTKHLDKSSPKLFLACANGTHIKQVTIEIGKNGKQVTYNLTDVLIATAQTGGGHGNQLTESFTLNYNKLNIKIGK